MSEPLELLLSPLRLRDLRLANRIVSTAHGVRLAADHAPSERDVAYYAEKARGGVGLIVQEAIRVHPTTVPNAAAIVGYDRCGLPAMRRLVGAVHDAGAPILAQICHQGRQASSAHSRLPLWAPSAIPGYYNHETPHAMDLAEIEIVVRAHADCARNVLEAGYDGVEIHAGHGYLLQEFLSPLSNRRTDGYGGSLERRARLMGEVVAAVREAAGDAVVGLRVSADEFVPGGLRPAEACAAVAGVVAAGGLDYVSVSQCSYEDASLSTMVPDMHVEPGAYAYLAAAVKEAIPDTPVLAVGRINTPELGERVLRETGADLVGMTRANIADPQLTRKAAAGRSDRIRPCVALNVCWRTAVASGMPVTCAVNPAAGREAEWGAGTLPRAAAARRVAVAGGGPAGLEAARVLAEAGHAVVLLEREDELGGQLRLAARAPGRDALGAWVGWAVRELEHAGVDVRLGAEATPAALAGLRPDAVVLATGSTASLGDLEVADGAVAVNARDVLAGTARLDGRVLVVDREWEWQAPTTAEALSEAGLAVEVLTEKVHLGVRIPANSLPTALGRLERRGIPVHPMLRAVRVTPGAVHVRHVFTQDEQVLDGFGAVVVAGDSVADDGLRTALNGALRVIPAGDCVAPRQLVDAVHDGHAAARELAAEWAAP